MRRRLSMINQHREYLGLRPGLWWVQGRHTETLIDVNVTLVLMIFYFYFNGHG